MIKFEETEVVGWEAAIRGMRNPMNSWDKSDTGYIKECSTCKYYDEDDGICRADDWSGQPINTENCYEFKIGPNDLKLMMNLRKAGPDHRKFMRMIIVYVDITAPLYWWKEFDTYKVGTVANSCSTMHKIGDKEFTWEDFSCEHLVSGWHDPNIVGDDEAIQSGSIEVMEHTIEVLNRMRKSYLFAKNKLKRKDLSLAERKHTQNQMKLYWWQMIQLLPSSYNQKRTVMMSYEVLANQYGRKNHKLDEWKEHDYLSKEDLSYENTFQKHAGFCDWIRTLPYSELITGEEGE